MPSNARLADIWAGVCVCHVPPVGMAGPIVTSASTVFADGRGKARFGDITIGYCGHPGVIVTYSSTTTVEGSPDARLTDAVVGCNVGVIVTGSGTVTTDS